MKSGSNIKQQTLYLLILQGLLLLTSCNNQMDTSTLIYYSPKYHLIHNYEKISYIKEIQIDALLENDSTATISLGPLTFKNNVIDLDSISINGSNKRFCEFLINVKEYALIIVDLDYETHAIKKNDIKTIELFFPLK